MDLLSPRKGPTAERPLLGLTVLIVEDSRYASEAMRLLCLRSGARIRRADCLRSARRHLQTYRPQVLIVDIGLPDGSGLDLIEDLQTSPIRPEALLAMSGDPDGAAQAAASGADAFLAKPLDSLSAFQGAVLACLPEDRQPRGPRRLADPRIDADPLALKEDMELAATLLRTGADEPETVDYLCQFLSGIARQSGDTPLEQAVARLSSRAGDGGSVLRSLIEERLRRKVAI